MDLLSSVQQHSSALIWEWIADYNCYSLLNDHAKLDDIENFVMLMKNVNQSLFFNNDEILKNVKSNLQENELDDACKRILYACIVIQAFFSFEKDIDKIAFLEKELLPLESILNLINSMQPCFSELEQDLLINLWIVVFKELVKRQLHSKSYSKQFLHDIISKFGTNVSESSKASVLAFSDKLDAKEQTINHQEFFVSILSIIFQLHSTLEEPFLMKVQLKLASQKSDESNVNTVDQNMYAHVSSQLALLQKLATDNLSSIPLTDNSNNSSINELSDASDTGNSFVTAESNNQNENEVFGNSKNDISDAFLDHQEQLRSSTPITVSRVENRTSSRNKSSNKDKIWSLQHDAFLIAGVEKFGVGAWNKIKQSYSFPLLDTGNGIKDRWNTLLQNKMVELYPDNTIKKINSRYNKHLRMARKRGDNSSRPSKPLKKVSGLNENLHGQPKHIDKTFLNLTDHPKPIFAGRKAWSKQEDVYLISGVIKHGQSWAKILNMFPFASKRTGVHLKDRWRNLKKNNLVTVNENGKVVDMASDYRISLDNL